MCGIFGYIGNDAAKVITNGLTRLEYRGYDSWGIAVLHDNKIYATKKIGAIGGEKEVELPQGAHMGIGHTRWATHGGVTRENAHPHMAQDRSFALAQNGIVENHTLLKEKLLKKGYAFHTQTDTEVIVKLIEDHKKRADNIVRAVRNAFLELEGRNTIIVMTYDNRVIAIRNKSPLVIGHNTNTGEYFFSSDTLSFAPYADAMIVLDNGQMAYYFNDSVELFNIHTWKDIPIRMESITLENDTVSKEGFPHFMIKEIHESPHVITQLINQVQRDGEKYESFATAIREARQVYAIGSGTAGAAAAQIAFYLRNYANINAISLIGADAYEYYALFAEDDLIIAPSQSGETADVLQVLEYVKDIGMITASFVNMPGATMTRIADYHFMAQAGPEMSVMSTKVFTSQIVWGYLVAHVVAGTVREAVRELHDLSELIHHYLEDVHVQNNLRTIAKHLSVADNIFLLGKYQNLQIVKEGMVKMIECTYKHAHAIPAGDLKHYAITLMEKGVPVLFAISNDPVETEVINAVSEVKARGATVIGISPQGHEAFDHHIAVPQISGASAIMNIIPLQLLAYYMGVTMGRNIDRPRNIAKSVTVT